MTRAYEPYSASPAPAAPTAPPAADGAPGGQRGGAKPDTPPGSLYSDATRAVLAAAERYRVACEAYDQRERAWLAASEAWLAEVSPDPVPIDAVYADAIDAMCAARVARASALEALLAAARGER